MEETETGKLVRVIELEPVEVRCIECDSVIGESLTVMNVYCEDCFVTIKDKRDELEDTINKIREMTEE